MDAKEKQGNAEVVTFEEAVLRTKVAQICEHVGYVAITKDCSNILADLYRRIIFQFARHCKENAFNNRRIESTLTDLVQACDFIGISIPELKEHVDSVKLPWNLEISESEQKPSNRIQRDLLLDDLLEAEKNNQTEDQDDAENQILEESNLDEETNANLLKNSYQEIVNNFPDATPVGADKKIRILLLANPKIKISAPILPEEPQASTSGADTKALKKKKRNKNVDQIEDEDANTAVEKARPSPIKKGRSKRKFAGDSMIAKVKAKKIKEEAKSKAKGKGRGKGRSLKKASRKAEKSRPVAPLDPSIAEPPTFFPILEEANEPSNFDDVTPTKAKGPKGKGRKRPSDEVTPIKVEPTVPHETKEGSGGKGKKKLKTVTAPLNPEIAEPPSFLPIIGSQVEEKIPSTSAETTARAVSVLKHASKVRKKKKSTNQFAIVTETVTTQEGDAEWFCPACGGPDDGDLMVQCDKCEEWYHLGCTNLKKPPEEEENWKCEICITKERALKHKPQTPSEVIKTKTPEPVVKIEASTPPPTQQLQEPPPAPPVGTSPEDLCPVCNLPDDGDMMIQCDDPFCARWFHGKCVNLSQEPKEDESWFCAACVDKQQSAFQRRRRAK